VKQKTQFNAFSAKAASMKDFLYGTLYKLNLITVAGTYDVFVYHDHSTE